VTSPGCRAAGTVLLVASVLWAGAAARAEEGLPRIGVGVAIGSPGEGSGPPIAGHNWPVALTVRWRLRRPELPVDLSIVGGAGIPIAGVGLSGWLGLQIGRQVVGRGARTSLSVYACPGLRAGLVGPDYYARHSHVLVGYEYIYSGPWTVAPRLPIGVAVEMSRGRAEVYAELLPELSLSPSVELLWGGTLGARFFF
jgi:hypothetical protein